MFRFHEHEVEDDVVTCETVQDEKCEDVTQGYTTEQKCTKWPREVCTKEKKTVLKYSPETECKKVPRELCGPSGCVLTPGPEECFDKKETVITEVPEETCNLEPQKQCKHVTKLVSGLTNLTLKTKASYLINFRCLCSSLNRSASTFPRRSVLELGPIPGKYKSLSSRSGATSRPRSPAWPNHIRSYN